jgi:ribonuclease R
MHRDGYGFLIPDHPPAGISGDIFLARGAAKGAMNGDRAIAKITFVGKDQRAEGEIVRMLRRAHPTVVGEFRITRRGMFVAPQDERLREWIEIPDDMAIPPSDAAVNRIGPKPMEISDPSDLEGMIVNAELLDYGEDGDHPVGRIIEVLGAPDDFGIDVEIVIRKHHIPHRFPPEVTEQAQVVTNVIRAQDLAGRSDFRALPIVTIDGETARDFDDAVLVNRLSNGHFELQVHIADVSHYVRPGSPIDIEARMRGTSVYFPDRDLLAESERGPAGAFGAARNRPAGRAGELPVRTRRDPQCGAHDVYGRPSAARGGCRAARPLSASGGAL